MVKEVWWKLWSRKLRRGSCGRGEEVVVEEVGKIVVEEVGRKSWLSEKVGRSRMWRRWRGRRG